MLKLLLKGVPHRVTVNHSNEFFHLMIAGRTGSGKTRLLIKLLRTEFFKKFNAIFLICPTFVKNQSYDSFCSDDKFFVLSSPIEQLDESIQIARNEAEKYYRSLVIFDDVIGNTLMGARKSSYVNMLIGGRHDGISTITLTQQLTSVSKPARDQMTRVVSFYNPDADDRRIMFDKYLYDVPKSEKDEIIRHLRQIDYAYVDICILRGTYSLG